MKPFRERNPIPIAIAGIVLLFGLLVAAFNAQHLPFIGGGSTYYADFTDASNLQLNDDVRIAGVKVGQVTSIELHGTVVQVGFTVKGASFGPDSSAAIDIKTLLGEKYIDLQPDGAGQMAPGSVIPVTRTTTPFDVTTAFIGLAQHVETINTSQLAAAFNTLASTFQNSAPEVHSALVGLGRFSNTIASRDVVLTELLGHARNVTAVLASRDAQVTRLINDGDVVLQLVEQQRAVIHDLLVNSSALAEQLAGLVQDNRATLSPAEANLHATLNILVKDQSELDNAIHLLAPFVRNFTDTLGSGGWFDTVVWNLGAPNSNAPLNPEVVCNATGSTDLADCPGVAP